jgi:hypothetical protein
VVRVHTTKTRNRTSNRLSALKVAKTKEPGLYEDGAGLRLVITDKGTKRWALRLDHQRSPRRARPRYLSGCQFGRCKTQGRGISPSGEERVGRAWRGRQFAGVTFSDAFEAFFDVRRQHLANGKHVQ